VGSPSTAMAQIVSLAPATMPPIRTVDERYQSYNLEMVEVTGGKFWKPYGPEPDANLRQPAPSGGDTPSSMNSSLYQYRRPPRPVQCATAQAGGRPRAGLCSPQRDVG
jgi:hypothetical protein